MLARIKLRGTLGSPGRSHCIVAHRRFDAAKPPHPGPLPGEWEKRAVSTQSPITHRAWPTIPRNSSSAGRCFRPTRRQSSFAVNELAGKHDRSSKYPDNALAQRLELISRLLKNDSRARVFYTVQSGYDTHASQLQTQANLLNELSSALKAFLDDLKEARLDDRVLVLAFSEFGRRVAENDSMGTDHGTAGPVFLAGPGVNAGLHGQTPSLTDLDAGDLKSSTDFRDVYATVLDKWLNLRGPEALSKFNGMRSDSRFLNECEIGLRKRNGSANCSADQRKQRPFAAVMLHPARRGIVQDHRRVFARLKLRRMLQCQEGDCIRFLSSLIALRNAPARMRWANLASYTPTSWRNKVKSMLDRSEPIAGPVTRRDFLAISSVIPAVIIGESIGAVGFAEEPAAAALSPPKKYPIGLELYSVRTELARDLPNTLRNVAKIGYEVVEFYAPYYDWSLPIAKTVRSLMDDLNLRCYSTHNHIDSFTPGDKMAKAIELNQILGSRLIVLASAPAERTDWRAGSDFVGNSLPPSISETARAGGRFSQPPDRMGPLAGERRVMDIIAANTPKEFVLQLDVGTCVEAVRTRWPGSRQTPGGSKCYTSKIGRLARVLRKKVIGLCLAKVFRPGRKSSPPAKRWAEWSIT